MTEYKLSWAELAGMAKQIAEVISDTLGNEAPVLYGIPRGGVYAALLVYRAIKGAALITESIEDANVIIDDIVDTGRTKDKYIKAHPNTLFFSLIHKKSPEQWFSFPWERMQTETGPEENIIRILQYLGEDPKREGLQNTPHRVVSSWGRLFGGYKQDPKSILKTTFIEGACSEMVVLRGIEFYSHCEHHMMPFFGKAHIGYIPKGRVVGISKLARLLEAYSRRLQIQERIGQQITDTITEVLQPEGCGCVLEAQHFCMTSRGVEKQNSIMVTSSMRGCFMEPGVKNEFLRFIEQ